LNPARTITVALASRNDGKVREIMSILSAAGVSGVVVEPADRYDGWVAPEETEPDYAGNALLKARSLAAFAGVAAIADDSGIEVDALGGAPGPRSARYAGAEATDRANLEKLIDAIVPVAESARTARYRCVAVLVSPAGTIDLAEGTVEGTLITEPRGTGGFGYDPIFVPVGEMRTMAELTPEEKDAISHRGKAFRALVPALARLAE